MNRGEVNAVVECPRISGFTVQHTVLTAWAGWDGVWCVYHGHGLLILHGLTVPPQRTQFWVYVGFVSSEPEKKRLVCGTFG